MPGALIGALRVTLGIDASQFENGVRGATRHARQMERNLERMGQRITRAGQILSIGITLPVVAFGRHAFQVATDTAELESAFVQTFGSMSTSMRAWAVATGDAMGRSTREILEGANAFGLYFNQAARTRQEAAQLSRQFTVLAQDLSSFHNTSVDEALLALRSGLSGETEPLRRFGVFLNEAAVQQQALAMGMRPVNGRLTDQQKIMARAAIIMRATANAQGDVMRTSQGTANQLRASQAAWEELSLVVGTQLIPLLTPLITRFTELVRSFTNLAPETQRLVLGLVAVGATLGPIMMALGPLVGLMGRLLPLLAGVGAGATTWTTLGTAILAFGRGALMVLGPIGVALGAIWLAWQHWDRIAPILNSVYEALNQALGPSIRSMIEGLSNVLDALWNGPLGQALTYVVRELAEVGAAMMQYLGPAALAILRGLGATFATIFQGIGDVLNILAALLRGDFSGAWEAAKTAVVNMVQGIGSIFEAIFPGIGRWISDTYQAVRRWLVDGLNNAATAVRQSIERIAAPFRWLYDVVVGHSYVPDMINRIGEEFDRLDDEMVEKAEQTAERTAEAFRALASEVSGILDDLFPEESAARADRGRRNALDKARDQGLISPETHAEAIRRIEQRAAEEENNRLKEQAGQAEEELDAYEDKLNEAKQATDEFRRTVGDMQIETTNRTALIIDGFARMAEGVIGSIQSTVDAFKRKDWGSVLSNVLQLVAQVIGAIQGTKAAGGGLLGFLTAFGSVGGMIGGARSSGPGFSTGGSFRIGGSGGVDSQMIRFRGTPGEIVNVQRGDLARRPETILVKVAASEYFDARVERVAGPLAETAAANGALGGAHLGQAQAQRRQMRRLA